MNNTATIFDIHRCSFSDGPGIRTTIFFKGCNMHCAWCHNPEGQLQIPQVLFYEKRCVGCGKCKGICPNHFETCELCGACADICKAEARMLCGKQYTVDEIMKECLKDKKFYETSNGGVTFSGGECMLNIDFLEALVKRCKEQGLHTAIDTAGCVPYEAFERIHPYVDLYLYDIKCINNDTHIKFTGVGNELILENLKKLLAAKKDIIIRIPVIEGVNDSVSEMNEIRQFFATYGKPKQVELLPYHKMGCVKYEALSMETPVFQAPSDAKMAELRQIFQL